MTLGDLAIRTVRAALVASVLAGLVAACGVLPNPLSTPVPPDALHPNQPRPAVDPASPAAVADPVKVGELAQRKAQWDRLGIGDYTLTVLYGCECALAGQPVDVTVSGGRVAGAMLAGQPLPLDSLHGYPATVAELFAYAERFAGAGKIEFKFDEQFGLPVVIGIDPDLNKRDDEVRIAIMTFDPTP